MKSRTERILVVLTDMLAVNASWLLYYMIRVKSGWITVPIEPELLAPMIVVSIFWLLTFVLVGLYRPFYAGSRFDEIALVLKTVSFGCLFLFFVVFVDDAGSQTGTSTRTLIAAYWAIMLVFVGGGRLILRSVQRRMLIAGIGVHNTIIVGDAARAKDLYDEVRKYPALGLRVVGFVRLDHRWRESQYPEVPILGDLDDLPRVMTESSASEVLIALQSTDHDRLLDVVARCGAFNVGIKIVPDLYEIISGMAKTNAIYGFPLIDISPQLLKPWEEALKRGLDIAVSATVLVLGAPLWLFIAGLIKLDSRGPLLYKQDRVGRDGKHFSMYKFRSMQSDAEKGGPQWAQKKDPRVTRVGRVLRNLHLDEIPQAINVLKGEMSLVGPRPERPVFVEQLSREIPMYPRRLRVRPGITGWAQVKHKYDESIEDVRKKVQYDLFYIENMSIRMDMKIIANTLAHMILGKGH